jgi:hypothetical protein
MIISQENSSLAINTDCPAKQPSGSLAKQSSGLSAKQSSGLAANLSELELEFQCCSCANVCRPPSQIFQVQNTDLRKTYR